MSKRIKKELRRRIKKRSQDYYVNPKRAKVFKALGVVGLLNLIINLIIIAYQYDRGNYLDAYDLLIRFSFTIFTFCYTCYVYLMGLSPPIKETKIDLDNWIFSIELKKE